MAENKLLRDSSLATVINKNAALTNGSRAAGDYDNSTELDAYGEFYLQVQYDTTAPSAGAAVAELYVLPGDGAGTEVFPEGGDGTVGGNRDPQKAFLVHVFESRNPSISADEVLGSPSIPLYGHTNRCVIKNVSGQQFDLTWELRLKPGKSQSV